MRDHLAKAFQWFRGTLVPLQPREIRIESITDLWEAEVVLADEERIAWDIETDGVDWHTRTRCIGFGAEHVAYILRIRDLNGRPLEGQIVPGLAEAVLRYLAANQDRLVGHNSGQFDRRVIANEFGVELRSAEDTIIEHQLKGDGLPRNLGFLGAWLTPQIDAWKAEHTALSARDMDELTDYLTNDVATTHAVRTALTRRGGGSPHLREKEYALQEVGLNMTRVGMLADRYGAWELREALEAEITASRERLDAALPGLNPNSVAQLAKVFFGEWRLPVVSVSEKTLRPSIDDTALRTWVATGILTPEQEETVLELRLYRRNRKLVSTYLNPIISGDALDRDGYIRSSYGRLPTSGRYNSSGPNVQNWPEMLRRLIIAPPGCAFVGADQAGLEARRLAEVCDDSKVIEIILSGADLHNETLEWVYGKDVWALDGTPPPLVRTGKGRKDSDFALARARVKNVRYAYQYAARAKTVREQIGRVEMQVDGRTTFPFATMPLEEVLFIMNRLKAMSPGMSVWWGITEGEFMRRGYVEETVWGRRRYFSHGYTLSDLVNHPIQGSGAALVHEAMFDLLGMREHCTGTVRNRPDFQFEPLQFRDGYGILTQTHDNLVLCVPEDEAPDWSVVLEEVMHRYTKLGRIPYVGDAAIGYTWGEV
jgi:DNA polymerase I-like protein with 3'-5' exonuclease and polymerase domains